MSPLLARVMLTIFMLPCAAIVYVIAVVCGEKLRRETSLFWGSYWREPIWLLAGVVTSCFVAAYWLLLWRRSVNWTARRRARTAWASVVAIAVAAGAGLLMTGLDREVGYFVGTAVAPLLWLVLTTLAWRETPDERAARSAGGAGVACPTCGYNLTGLRGTRCPECGTEFTLDQLLAARRESAGSELV